MKAMTSSVHILAMLGFLLHVGCDGVVGSAKRVDACGVCGGDNSTCRVVSGLFTRPQLPVGYNIIAQIPRGACNITISELKQSRNYLALRRSDGNYIINGNWAINWSGEYEAVGTRFTYRRQDANSGELIEAPGPLLDPVDLVVIYQQPNPGIKYEYMLPMKPGDLTPAMMSVPSLSRTISDNGIIAPPLLLPPGFSNPTDDITVKSGPTLDAVDTRRSDDPLYPYGSGVQGTESQGHGNHHPGHHNVTPIGDEAHKPQTRTRARKRKFVWKITGYTECTKTCGGGNVSTSAKRTERTGQDYNLPQLQHPSVSSCFYRRSQHYITGQTGQLNGRKTWPTTDERILRTHSRWNKLPFEGQPTFEHST